MYEFYHATLILVNFVVKSQFFKSGLNNKKINIQGFIVNFMSILLKQLYNFLFSTIEQKINSPELAGQTGHWGIFWRNMSGRMSSAVTLCPQIVHDAVAKDPKITTHWDSIKVITLLFVKCISNLSVLIGNLQKQSKRIIMEH